MSSVSIDSSNSPDVETVIGHDSQLEILATNPPECAIAPARNHAGQTSCETAADAAEASSPSEASAQDTSTDEAAQSFVPSTADSHHLHPNHLAAQLAHLVESTAAVEELSRHARETAVGHLAHYEALVASAHEYAEGLERATSILDQARITLDHAFGLAARTAAQTLVSESERVHAAFEQLVDGWQSRAESFLTEHPDVDFLVRERLAKDEQARQQEIALARVRRHDALLAALNTALEAQIVVEARRALASLELEFPEEVDMLRDSKSRIVRAIREERDHAARQAMFVAGQYQMQDNLEAALDALERVNVTGLSVEVSQDVFGRWCDTCSRLAQETGADLVRYAPNQGRGLILLRDAARTNELEIFSALGMGPEFTRGTAIKLLLTDAELRDGDARKRAAVADLILRGARTFRAATTTPPQSNWSSYVSPPATAVVHH
jgi:hypothetical protein